MFKINDVEWNILYVNPNSECLMRSDGTITLGVTDWSKRTVYLSNALSGSLLEKVLSHELVHCASFSYDCHIPINVEEIVADFLSLYGKLDNKEEYASDRKNFKRKVLGIEAGCRE